MFKGLLRGLSKFFTTEKVIILVVFLILAWGLWTYSGTKSMRLDTMDTGKGAPTELTQVTPTVPQQPHVGQPTVTSSAPGVTAAAAGSVAAGYSSQSVANPQDLLPIDQHSQWAALNPVAQGNIAAPDLLQAGYHIGLDTIGQTLRNANLQERSDPIIPKAAVGPWNQSTIEPDLGRVPLEVGAGLR